MKAQGAYRLLKDRFPGKTICLEVTFWDFHRSNGTEKRFQIDVFDIGPPREITTGKGSSWQDAYNKFNKEAP